MIFRRVNVRRSVITRRKKKFLKDSGKKQTENFILRGILDAAIANDSLEKGFFSRIENFLFDKAPRPFAGTLHSLEEDEGRRKKWQIPDKKNAA